MGAFDDIPVISPPLPGAGGRKGKAAQLPAPKGNFDDLPYVPQKSPLIKNYGEILKDFAIKGPFSEKFQAEVAPAVPEFIPFNAATNASVEAQNGLDPKKIRDAAYKALPFTQAIEAALAGAEKGGAKGAVDEVLKLGSLTQPIDLKRPGQLIVNAVKAVNPQFKEPENPYAQLGLDVAGGLLTGAPQALAHAGAGAAIAAENNADALRALQALKNNPTRKLRIFQKGVKAKLESAPKALPAPMGYEIVPREEAIRRISERVQKIVGAAQPERAALPAPAEYSPAQADILTRIREAMDRVQGKDLKPALPAPGEPKLIEARGVGEGFQLSSKNQARTQILKPLERDAKKLSKYLQKDIEAEADTLADIASNIKGGQLVRPEGEAGYRTSLPDFLKHPETGNKPTSRKQFLELAEHNLKNGISAQGAADTFQENRAALDLIMRKIRRSPLSEEKPAAADQVKAELPDIKTLDEYFTPGKALTKEHKNFETAALKHFKENAEKALEDYKARVDDIFSSDRVVSGDEAKFIVPGVEPATMAAAHEPASAFAKFYRDILFKDPATKDKPVMILGGGSGAGKTRALRTSFPSLGDFSAIFDTNTNNLEAGIRNIELAKKNGRKAVYVYLERDPVKAWDSVIDRGLRTGRPVPMDVHIKNQGARETALALYKKYKSDPDVTFKFLDNTGDKVKELDFAKLKKSEYTSDGYKKALRGKLDETLNEKIRAGQLTEEQAEPFRFRSEKAANSSASGGPLLEASPKELQQSQLSGLNYPSKSSLSPSELLLRQVDAAKPAKKSSFLKLKNALSDERGQARFAKDYGSMSEEELRAEISKKLGRKFGEDLKERKFITQVRKADKTAPRVGAEIESTYEPITNKETLAAAEKMIAETPDEALRLAKSNDAPTALSNAVAIRLIDNFQKAGKFEDAIELVEHTAQKATSQGQAIQALSLYSRLTPEGVLRYAQKVLDTAKREVAGKAKLTPEEMAKLPKKIQNQLDKLKLTPERAQQFTELAKKIQDSNSPRQRAINTARLLKAVANQVPTPFWKKVSFVQTLAQLLNPKTAIRNIAGNTGFMALENISDATGAAFDKAVSVFTGKRSKVLPNLRVQFRGLQKGFREGMQDLEAGVRTNPAGTQYELPAPGIFKSKVGQSFEKMLNFELQVPDRMAYTAAYRESLLNQLKAAKATKPTDAMLELAHHDALYRTFQDDNVISTVFSKLKNALNAGGDFGLGDAVLKYPKTPANILARGIDYSPAGFVKTVFELSRPLMGEGFNQRAFVESASRAFTGTALVGTGILLSRLGLITGRKKESPGIVELKKKIGLGDYKLNVSGLKRFVLSGFDPDEAKMRKGDVLKTYDWFLPQAIDVAIGANIDENRGKPVGVVGTLADAIGSGTRTLAEQPLVSGLQRFFGYGDVVGGAAEMLKGVPASFVPTLLNQIKLLVDDVRRNPDNEDPFKEALNLVKMKIPGLSKSLPARKDPFSEEVHYLRDSSTPEDKALASLLDPAITSKYGEAKETPAAEQLIKYNVPVTQQAGKLRGIELTKEEQEAINSTTGPLAKKLLMAVIKTPGYQTANDLGKQKILESAVRSAKNAAEYKEAPAIARRYVGKKS